MEIIKSHWESHDGNLSLGVPIMKVDQDRRIVSGFATLDNIDRQRDIVLASASKAAFSAFQGNVREMHGKIAAGRVVSFREKMYFDPETQKMYEGIWVEVYVSKGAQSTWEKVLDKTLTGFSIGGAITEKDDVWNDEISGFITIVKAYYLTELSLVDAPANQLSNIFAIQKMADGETEVTGIAVDVETADVFWCSNDKLATIGTDGDCSVCGTTGEKVGWIESTLPQTEKAQAIAGLLKNMTAMPAVQKEEGVEKNMADETVEKADEVVATIDEVTVEKSDTSDTAEPTAKADATAEAGAGAVSNETAPVAAEQEIDWKAELASLRETLNSFGPALAGITKAIGTLETNATETNSKVEALGTTFNEAITKSQEAVKESVDSVASRVGDVEKSLVVKKAADRDGDTANVIEKQDIWADRFTVRSL
jgi:phage shock protein A